MTTTVANSSDTKQVSIETQQILSDIGTFSSLVDGDIRLVRTIMITKESQVTYGDFNEETVASL